MCIRDSGNLGETFDITVGTRQGCNLSPSLFNLYINDIPSLLDKGKCNPVDLYNAKINCLVYADDMLVLSKSKKGLSKALIILEIYCKKCRLKINANKTKIMIFNKHKYEDCNFQIDGRELENVQTYNYLGIKVSSSGSFITAIKELTNKAKRAYFAMKSSFIDSKISPKLFMKMYDILVKPITLYGCEIWGAFGHKMQPIENLCKMIYRNDKFPYEQLHLKACKASIGVSKHTNNFGIRSELGRLPLIFNIFVAICKYRIRLNSFKQNDLLYHAFQSQHKLNYNSYKSMTYSSFTDKLKHCLGIKCPNVQATSTQTSWDSQTNHIKNKCRQYTTLISFMNN